MINVCCMLTQFKKKKWIHSLTKTLNKAQKIHYGEQLYYCIFLFFSIICFWQLLQKSLKTHNLCICSYIYFFANQDGKVWTVWLPNDVDKKKGRKVVNCIMKVSKIYKIHINYSKYHTLSLTGIIFMVIHSLN